MTQDNTPITDRTVICHQCEILPFIRKHNLSKLMKSIYSVLKSMTSEDRNYFQCTHQGGIVDIAIEISEEIEFLNQSSI